MDTDFTSETADQAMPDRAKSAKDELHQLVIQARQVLAPAPAAIPVLSDPKVLDAIARRQAKKLRRRPRGQARGRRGYGPATGSPEIVDGPEPGQGRPETQHGPAQGRQRYGHWQP